MKNCSYTKKFNVSNKGFTLLELMIVVGIMVILAATSIVIFNPAEKQREQRDALRVSSLSQIASALELYYSEYKRYPSAISELSSFNVKVSLYDPSENTSCDYIYVTNITQSYYEVYSIKESSNFGIPRGQEFILEIPKESMDPTSGLFSSCDLVKSNVFKVSGGLAPVTGP